MKNSHEPLIYTSFPNDNKKRIDYVITYKLKEKEEEEFSFKKKELHRKLFFAQAAKESIETCVLNFK